MTRIKLHDSYWKHMMCVPFSEDVVPSSLFLRNRNFLVFDLETQTLVQEIGGWDYLKDLRVSVACAYDSQTDSFLTFYEQDLPQLIDLLSKRLVIGYNIRGFDLPVLQKYGLLDSVLKNLDTFDIMVDLERLTRQRYIKLESVARGTLGMGKSADGVLAVEWWKKGNIQKIIDYCLQDVRVTRDIFQFGRQKGFIYIQRSDSGDSLKKIDVKWN